MNLLAIDSSCSVLCTAVLSDDKILTAETDGAMKQSEIIMECVDNLMNKASLKPDDLNGVLCMKGPGSFTGLRIGYSIAKGLALSLSVPFAALSTLDCVAQGFLDISPLDYPHLALSIINASKDSFFYAFYRIVYNDINENIPSIKRITQDKDGKVSKIAEDILKYNEKISITGPGAFFISKSLPSEIKDICVINSENRGYAKELIAIAKNYKILDNNNTANLFSGPEYNRLPG